MIIANIWSECNKIEIIGEKMNKYSEFIMPCIRVQGECVYCEKKNADKFILSETVWLNSNFWL